MKPFVYVPILKAKQGEKIALRHVASSQWGHMLPLIELLEAPGNLKPHVDALCKDLLKANADKWPFAIDTRYLLGKGNSAKLLATICSYLTKKGILVVPVVGPAIIPALAGEMDKLDQYRDILVRLPVSAILASQVEKLIADIADSFPKPKRRIHVLLDFESIVGADPTTLVTLAEPYVKESLAASQSETVTVAGGSFPFNLVGILNGTHFLSRAEWRAWIALRKKYAEVRFGDYAVTNPAPLEPMDPTQINPSAAIRYALTDRWMLIKGGGTRTSGFGQYNQLCKLLVNSSNYSGLTFSYGDKRYDYHAQPGAKSGNLSTWRCDATSHHLAITLRDCANLFGIAI